MDPCIEFRLVERFGQVIIGTLLQTLYFRINGIPRSKHKNGCPFMLLPDLTDQIQTVAIGQTQIQDHQVITVNSNLLPCLLNGISSFGYKSILPEKSANIFGELLIVLYYQ